MGSEIQLLVFEVGGFTLGVPAADVARISAGETLADRERFGSAVPGEVCELTLVPSCAPTRAIKVDQVCEVVVGEAKQLIPISKWWDSAGVASWVWGFLIREDQPPLVLVDLEELASNDPVTKGVVDAAARASKTHGGSKSGFDPCQ